MRQKFLIHKKFIFTVIAMVLIYALLMSYIRPVFMAKDNHYYAVNSDVTDLPYFAEKWDGFYEKDKNTIDVLFLGTSIIHTDIDVNQMYHDYGFTSYDLSADQHSGADILYFLKEALKYQNPKVVFIDVQSMSNAYQYNEISAHYSYDFMKTGINKLQGVMSLRNLSVENIMFPFTKYHARWEELSQSDFDYVFMDKTNMLNGHFCYMMQNPVEIPTEYEASSCTLSELGYNDTEKCLNDVVEYCAQNGLECVLLRTPLSYSYWNSKYYDALGLYAEEHGVKFWNCNDYYDEIGTDFSTDFIDIWHMNQVGAQKLSIFLGRKISENFELEDHREKPGYEEWDQAYDYQNYLMHSFEIRHYINAQEYADNLDYDSENLVFFYTYDSIDDLKKVAGIPSAVNEIASCEATSLTSVLYQGNVVENVNLNSSESWKGINDYVSGGVEIESIGGDTKLWFGNEYHITEDAAGFVDVIIYDIKLGKILEHAKINVNWESYLTHLYNP